MASDGIDLGCVNCVQFLDRFLKDFEAISAFEDRKYLLNSELACYLKGKIHLSMINNEYIDTEVIELFYHLMKRQEDDGAWRASAYYEIEYYSELTGNEWDSYEYYGSKNETTGFALSALSKYNEAISR